MANILNYIYDNLLSLIAIIISLFNAIYYLINNRKNVAFNINCYTIGNVKDEMFYMYDVDFINKSSLPISVNGIKIIDGKNDYSIINSPRKLFEKKSCINNTIINLEKIDSVSFPINLESFHSEHGFIIMYGPKSFKNKNQKIVISTSRGKIKRKLNLKEKYISTNEFMKSKKYYGK